MAGVLPHCGTSGLAQWRSCKHAPRRILRQPAGSGRAGAPRASRTQRRVPVAASLGAVPDGDGSQPSSSNSNGLWWGVGTLAALAAGGYALATSGHAGPLKTALIDGPLGRSGFLAAFSLIFLSEMGDKTFFIAALLAMRLGRWISFVGSLGALAVMTVISVAIGALCSRVPDALKSTVPIGEIAGVLLLVVFGIRALREAAKSGGEASAADDELADAEETVKEAQSGGKVSTRESSKLSNILEVASLIFLAEWGDRSMIATIALGAAQNPVGVAVGATVGHAVATAIAVVGGALAGKHVSERGINFASGILFLLFAAATVYAML